jgi:hypothetical protein
MRITSPKHFHTIEIFTFLLITLWGVVQGQVTVFYIIYFFWFQLLIRTIIDIVYAGRNGEEDGTKPTPAVITGSMFIYFCYLLLIIVFFGVMLNFDNQDLIIINLRTLVLRNIGFDLNLMLFAIQYSLYRKQIGNKDLQIALFDRGHLILHISIIVGAFIQMLFVKKHPEYFSGHELWGSALVVLPFLLLKIWITRKRQKQIE